MYHVYIMANHKRGALYIGVTNDLARRVGQHRKGTGSSHAHRVRATRLVYAEEYENIDEAIAREKAMKKWKRLWKIELIEKANPDWRDWWFDLNR